jgi:phytoene desaturase
VRNNISGTKRVVVIGSGIAGLSVAIRLAVQGHKVSVFERNPYAGGKIYDWRKDGFRFDMGPSVFTMPEYLEELFVLAGKNPADYIKIIKPELPFSYFFNSGEFINFYSDQEKLVSEIAQKTSDSQASVKAYLDNIKIKYDLTKNVFLQKSLHIPSNYFSMEALKGFLNLGKLSVFESMDECNRRILKDSRTINIFNSFASYVGSNPYRAPAVLNVISHVQLGGVFLPIGGMRSITESVYKLCNDIGVEVHLNASVDEVIIRNNKAVGIRVGKEEILADIVVSGMDVENTYKQLMPSAKRPQRIFNQMKSQSFLIYLWGMKKKFPQLALHNMFLPHDTKAEYHCIQNDSNIGEDFSIYIYISSKLNPSDAPEGCENWYILINAPHLNGQDWDEIKDRVRVRIIEKLNRVLGEDVSSQIAFENTKDPRDHQSQTNTALGAIYGNSFNRWFSVFMRHPNFSSRIKNLYFCGATVHPGGGIPLSILSSKIVADIIQKDH